MKHAVILLLYMVISSTIHIHAQKTDYGIIRKTDKGITFAVDENLPSPENKNKKIIKADSRYIASSFANDSLQDIGQDVLFRCMIKAYAEHKPLVLSPDMIWLDICQVFGHHISTDAKTMRDKFVGHDGKISLVVSSEKELLSENADWPQIMDSFINQIDRNTKGNIAKTITADFSTTGVNERIASGITLMKTMEPYFEYVVILIGCGIPEITLTGTPDDWKKVMEKTTALEGYGMDQWIKDLKPVLHEFIKASEGRPNRQFWKDIVMKDRPDRLRGGICEKPTVLDGWFLKLFPYDKYGKRIKKVEHNITKMLPEMVKVSFRYIIAKSTGTKELPMGLQAGFIGIEEDATTHALTPKIGWAVCMTDTNKEEKMLKNMTEMSKKGISIRIKEVPQVLSKLKEIKRLELRFIDEVSLPSWMDNINIGELIIRGKVSAKEKIEIKKRFPDALITP
ncbi:DUF4419 domain-containing protein [Xylanibacter muris]|uniref:DUF4419 domain-containing protein n=1 Tax=Xylanibacter muris TaxID=2736290 RepID=A0ABX2AQN0_9BACT|nr:DUF4419 domain-containing protein [Xylanibacter muris]NPD92347.1 DUF4419 domain-containing protein [Xylanibacter muris]